MSEMIERVARAMWDARELTLPARARVPFDDRLTGDIWVMARAAIAAMREPTPEMIQAGAERVFAASPTVTEVDRYDAAKVYRAMIDSALKEG